ncbi:MAG: McrC family protein [Cetobacterium sp.]|uniref:McrC family protein n=1 Tax=Cetobacterium sp. TaxID=2071632 RepID=UPI002FCC2E4B
MSDKRDVTLTEYSSIFIGTENDGKNIAVNKKTFEEIETFVLENSDHVQYFKLGQNKRGKFLQAQNYVGIIQTKSGRTIEILPKIAKLDEEEDIEKSKKILLKMLRTLKDSPFKTTKIANLKVEKMTLYEIFIRMFLEELSLLIKKGIKSDYIKKEDNLKYLKGRLKIADQIKKNSIHKERFSVEYDEFSSERLENRIIKTTLDFLYKKCTTLTNKKRIREFKFIFEDIKPVYDYNSCFSKIKLGRDMKNYEQVLKWCKVFLLNNSFSPYKGSEIAFALLFDMNKLFESYIGDYLRKKDEIENLKLQDREHHLVYVDESGRFGLRPDIVIETEEKTIICDTKWKIMSKEPSQEDMYQLYAYGTKYEKCKKLYLIYPLVDGSAPLQYDFRIEKSLELEVIYFNLHENIFHERGIDI